MDDKCEDCWWLFGIGPRCNHPANRSRDSQDRTPCGWFEPKVKQKEEDRFTEYEAIRREFN